MEAISAKCVECGALWILPNVQGVSAEKYRCTSCEGRLGPETKVRYRELGPMYWCKEEWSLGFEIHTPIEDQYRVLLELFEEIWEKRRIVGHKNATKGIPYSKMHHTMRRVMKQYTKEDRERDWLYGRQSMEE